MPHQLLLMRHAKSSWDSDAPTDFLRPLASRGRKAAPRVARWLKAQALTPERIISSPAERARETALAVVDVLGLDDSQVQWVEQVYDASQSTLVDVVRSISEPLRRVMLIGHNPGFEELLAWLCADDTPQPPDGKLLPTAAVAVLDIDSRWRDVRRGGAELMHLVRPRELKKN